MKFFGSSAQRKQNLRHPSRICRNDFLAAFMQTNFFIIFEIYGKSGTLHEKTFPETAWKRLRYHHGIA